MNPRVKNVVPKDEYLLIIEFNNGEKKSYDVKPLLNFGIFSELKNNLYFKKVKVENGTITWPNGQDICPDTLYVDSISLIV